MKRSISLLPGGPLSNTSKGTRSALPRLLFLCPLLFWLLFLPERTYAQNTVTVNYAQQIIGTTLEGERVRKLIGEVSIETGNLAMFCDSAYQYLDREEVRAFGNIEIDTQQELIFADTLVYYTDVDFSQLRGRVIIKTDSTTIYSNAVDYRFSTKVGHFLERVRLEDESGILTADSGFYYREPDSAVFRGDVQLRDSLQYIEGDSLFINRRTRNYELYGAPLFVDDEENSVMLQGDSLRVDSTGHRYLWGNSAWLKKFNADTASSDTTHIRSRIIHALREVAETDTQTVINAYRDVRIWSPKFAATSDTARYDSGQERFILTSNPKAWTDQIQLTGPYIEVTLVDEEIDRLDSFPGTFTVQRDTSINRLNQIRGDTLTADFTEGEISTVHVRPNSRVLQFTKNENGEADGAIEMTAPSTRIFFEDGEVLEAKADGPVNGSYFPESEQTANRRLDGFSWNPDERPAEPHEIMQRRLPPIPDVPPFELPTRYVRALQR